MSQITVNEPSHRAASSARPKRNTVLMVLDLGLALGFALVMARQLTTQLWHEWLGVTLLAALILHLLLHWKWVVAVARRLRNTPARARFSLIQTALLLCSFLAAGVTGLVISKDVLPLHLAGPATRSWEALHFASADLCLLLVASHIAFHWGWVTTTLGRVRGRRAATRKVAP